MRETVRHERIRGDGIDLHVAVAGEGPPVVLLHGFPENWTSWRQQIPALARAGFSVWVPDLRGYNESDRPTARKAYHIRHLMADVAAVVEATGAPRAHIVGHDWGGVVAWAFAGHYSALVDRLAVLNGPHVDIYLREVRRPPQLFRSWYIAFFLLPWLPELALSAGNFAAVRAMFKRTPSRPGAFREADIDAFVDALSTRGALTAALSYYRENIRSDGMATARAARITAETLVVWGERDPALGMQLLNGLERVAPRVQVRTLHGVGHWIQTEAPDAVNRLLTEFLTHGRAHS